MRDNLYVTTADAPPPTVPAARDAACVAVRVEVSVVVGTCEAVTDCVAVVVGVWEHVDTRAVDPAAQQGHAPVQADVVRPVVDPYVPAGQSVDAFDPAGQYEPIGHMTAVALLEPAGHV